MSDGLNGWGTTDTELPVSPLFCHLKDQLSPGSPGLKNTYVQLDGQFVLAQLMLF